MEKYLGVFIVLIVLYSCSKDKEQSRVIGVHNRPDFEELKELKLDDYYVNLLNPKFSKKEDFKGVLKSWGDFHNKVNEVLVANDFSWEIPDSSITVVNKIYFNKYGKVNYFLVNVRNENVTNEVKNKYISLLNSHLDELSIELKREGQFSQCGKVKYKNYE
ncbi:hypothetical protein BTO06_02550 [Tenacibaculum sp. SZ-18]|uniref:hypothetical protein n=1 Tax=Tenacibaculum sp. SZ-18 TaxID=754423 RepID=UPI000C2D0777|nr:hypothetical protein [Tenacibaculum sp. SZ-18]AUC14107.1 hypothetical protein BTO06_02550 [Tenacibaculum sp. SZ-18]